MATPRAAWGIDLGNRALKAVKLIREGDSYRIADYEVIEHEQILSVAGDNKEALLRTALANLVDRHDFKNSVVGVSVSGQSSFARFIKLPPVEAKKIPEIVRFEAIQQIPFPLDDVEWSYQLFQAPDSPDVEVGIFAMRKDLVNRHISYFTDLGLNVQAVQMSPLAVYNAMYRDGRTAETTMFIDSGAENTDLIIADGETVWLRTLPIGGNNFTESLVKSFKLNFQKAEELKRTAAASKYAKQIFQAMRPVFADLVAEIQRSIGFYASVHRDARISKLVALGSTFQLPGLQKYLQQNLQLPVEKLDGLNAVPPEDTRLAQELPEQTIALAGAYGLALQALGDAKINSSLLPENIRRAKMWKEKTKWFASAAALVAVGTAIGYGTYFYHQAMYDQNKAIREQNKSTIRIAEDYSRRWKNEVETQGASDRARIMEVLSLQNYRGTWQDVLTTMVSYLPNKDPKELLKIKRKEREQIRIDNISSRYWPDLEPAIKSPSFDSWMGAAPATIDMPIPGDGALPEEDVIMDPSIEDLRTPGAPAVAAGPQTRRGYLLTIRGTTPNTAAFVDQALVEKLKKLTPDLQFKNGKQWYVARAEVVRANVRQPKLRGLPGEEPDLGAVNPGEVGGRRGEVKAAPIDPLADPFIPNEKIDQDTEFVVLVAIALDPHPAPVTQSENE